MKQNLVLALCVGSLFLASCSSPTTLEAPQNLRAIPGENSVTLSWEDRSNDEAGFAIYRSLASEANFIKLGRTAPADTENYTDNVDTTNSYIYQVRAFANDGRESAPSISESVSATKLAAPSNLSATPGENNIDLTWTDNSSVEEGFRIFRKLESEAAFPSDALTSVTANATSYSDSSASAGNSYVYQLIAFAGETTSDASNTSAPVTLNVPNPNPTPNPNPNPTPNPNPNPNPVKPVINNLKLPGDDTTYAPSTTVELTWTIVDQNQLSALRLERVDNSQVITSDKTATKANITLPVNIGTFTYRLTATSAGGSTSLDIQITTGSGPDILELNSTFVEGSERDFDLTWTMNGSAPFRFEVTLGGSTTTVVPTVSNGVYTVRVTRPPIDEDTQPGFLRAINNFGDAPNETQDDLEMF